VPADAFYEWKVIEGGKQPYAIARQDGRPMAFAGLWEVFKWPDGTATRTFTIITTNANDTMAQLHNRMPVILERQDWPVWLGEVAGDAASILRPAAEDVLKVWPVSRQVNSPKNDGADVGIVAYPAEIGPGVWDIDSPRVPDVVEITELLSLARQRLEEWQIWVNPDCGLKTRQWPEVRPALENMVAATAVLRRLPRRPDR